MFYIRKNNKKLIYIIIEVANRELDNALLLKAELEYRGYKVRILSKTEQLPLAAADLVITPNCYITQDYDFYRYRFNVPSGKLVNLQYEQVLSPIEEDNELYSLDSVTRQLTHICWGKHTVDRLTRKSVPKNRLPVTGAIQLDTTRDIFSSRWKTREQIATEFNLPLDKKWLIYISTFSCTSDSLISDVQKLCHEDENVNAFSRITDISQKLTLQWFDQLLSSNDEYVIIYRPHPVELSSPSVARMVKKYPGRFRQIQDYEIKQWLKVADIPCTWLSTSIAESYFTGKNCLIMRPVIVPADIDCVIYDNCNALKSYEEFISALREFKTDINEFPINRSLIEYYYEFSPVPAFNKIADTIDHVIEERVEIDASFSADRRHYLSKDYIHIKLLIKKIYRIWYRITGIKLGGTGLRKKFFIEEWEKTVNNKTNNAVSVAEKQKQFEAIIRKYHSAERGTE